MRDGDRAFVGRVPELLVAASLPNLDPASFRQPRDNLAAFHTVGSFDGPTFSSTQSP